jgi:MYXO-CTERM domain-containing protein
VTSTLPADGATYPANAALLIDGFDLSIDALDAIKVTVDGVAAKLVPADLGPNFATIAAMIEPQPAPGAAVVVSGNFCLDAGCDDTKLSFTAGAPDLTAPEPKPAAAFFGLYDHGDFMSSGGDCQSDSDMTFYLHVEQVVPADGEAPQRISAQYLPDGQGGFSDSVRTSDESARVIMSVVASQLAGADPIADVCFTVRHVDAAGNAAEPYEVCGACFQRKDEVVPPLSSPEEPAWSDVDAVPGSACAPVEGTTGDTTDATTDATTGDTTGATTGGTTSEPTPGDTGPEPTGTGEPQTTGEPETTGPDTGGDQEDDGKGCACDSDGGGSGPAALAALALLAARRRRARSMS